MDLDAEITAALLMWAKWRQIKWSQLLSVHHSMVWLNYRPTWWCFIKKIKVHESELNHATCGSVFTALVSQQQSAAAVMIRSMEEFHCSVLFSKWLHSHSGRHTEFNTTENKSLSFCNVTTELNLTQKKQAVGATFSIIFGFFCAFVFSGLFPVSFHLCSFHPRDLLAQVNCVWRVYLHSPPVSATLLICILGTEEKITVFIITCQQQEKQSKG